MPNNIRKYRIKSGLTLKQLSTLSDIPIEILCDYEDNWAMPDGYHIIKLNKILKTTTDKLLHYKWLDWEREKIKFYRKRKEKKDGENCIFW